MTNNRLADFLLERGINCEVVKNIEEDKIDSKVILMMSSDQLKNYFPAFGDRVAIKEFCKIEEDKEDEMLPKISLIEKLKLKINKRKSNVSSTEATEKVPKTHLHGNKNAAKNERRIELGWMHFSNKCKDYKQVRTRKGGGTRHITISKWGTIDDIITTGKHYFFPESTSPKGDISQFSCSISDFKGAEIMEGTIENIYKESGLKMLRLYFCTKRITNQENINTSRESEVHFGRISEEETSMADTLPLSPILLKSSRESEVHFGRLIDGETSMADTLPLSPILLKSSRESEVHFGRLIEGETSMADTLPLSPILLKSSRESEVHFGRLIEEETSLADTLPLSPILLKSTSHVEAVNRVPEYEGNVDSAILPENVGNGHSEFDVQYSRIQLHRINLQSEMICTFKAQEIIHTPLKVSFINEKGSDAMGVSRDAYTSFWKSFFSSSADGEYVKVPAICPQYGHEEWQAIGRIIVKGFIDHRIFPLEMAPAYFITMMLGEDAVSPSELLESFFVYISENDRNIIQLALKNMDTVSDDDKETLLDILDQEGVKSLPDKENIEVIILQMAHKCIIQKNSYALHAIEDIVRSELKHFFPDAHSIKTLYDKSKLTCKKVLNLLKASPESSAENQSLRYLNQYIRAQNEQGLSQLLHFLTASRMIVVDSINVEFTALSGFERRPIAHTCGPVLELPSTYMSYRELRIEFDGILSSGYLAMDIV